MISPAYGRDYTTAEEVWKDYHDGKDFVYENLGGGGKYCSKRDFNQDDTVEIRYNKKADLVIFPIVEG